MIRTDIAWRTCRPDTRKPGAPPVRAYRTEVLELQKLGDAAWERGDNGVVWQGQAYVFDEYGELHEDFKYKD